MSNRNLTSLEAEHSVLGAMMQDPRLCEPVGAILDATDFSVPDHSILYNLILNSHSRGEKPDSVTLSELLPVLPSGEPTIVYASMLMANVPSTANAVRYAEIVLERSKARAMYTAGQRIMCIAETAGKIPEQVAAAQSIILDLNATDTTPDVVTHREALDSIVDEMQDRLDGVKMDGIEFGLADLDKIICRLRPGNLVIVAGRPGTGKTVLGLGLADKVAIDDGGGALVFSLEMTTKELTKRSLAARAHVSMAKIESGEAIQDGDSIVRITAAVAKMASADVRVCDKPGLTITRICSIARFQHRVKPLSAIVVDYVGLIGAEAHHSKLNRNQEIGQYTRALKGLAKELGIPVVALCQLNRSIETRADPKPKMSDLRDSGEIEQDADIIIILHRDNSSEHGEKGLTEADVPKVRHAKPGFCLLQFIGDQLRFASAVRGYEEEDPTPAPKKKRTTRDYLKDF